MRDDEDREHPIPLSRHAADVRLLRPRMLPLSPEQQVEAVELLSELLLEAARRSDRGDGATQPAADAAEDGGRDGNRRHVGQERWAA